MTLRSQLEDGRCTVYGKNGRSYVIRPIRPSDAPSLRRGYDAMPEQLKWFRLLHTMPHLTEDMALAFCTPDPQNDVCLVLEGRGDLDGEILGGARITGSLDDRSCEFSVSLRPEAQGLGLARGALQTALAAGMEMGYTRVWGSVHVCNEAMLRLARSMGFRVQRDPDDAALMVAEMVLRPCSTDETGFDPVGRTRDRTRTVSALGKIALGA